MRKSFCCLLSLLSIQFANAQDSLLQRIWLVGDAGKLSGDGSNAQLNFIKQTQLLDKKTTVLFLGDNVYQTGLPDSLAKTFTKKKAILDAQINLVLNTNAQGYFIPGNHDWLEGRKNGWQQILHESQYIKTLNRSNIHFSPEGGCPGPVEVPLDDKTLLVIMDTQWWLQQNERPGESSDCDCKTEDDVLTRLNDIVYRNRDKLLLFAAHHPFKTYGPHGGYFVFKQHLFPLTEVNEKLYIPFPVVGSLYPILRSTFGHIQDVKHPEYKDMIKKVDEILTRHPYCIRLSGHEHTLQFIQQNNQNYIVSGAGSKTSQVKKGDGTMYKDEGPGVAMLEIMKNGNIHLKFFVTTKGTTAAYETMLNKFQPLDLAAEKLVIPTFPDSMTTVAAPGFKASKLKRFFWGDNYRAEWTAPVTAPVFDISKEKGGLKTVSRGGRLQSMSLRLEDSAGQQYVLRSIVKYPERILPEEFRETFIKDALVDAISASYPYAAVSVPPLAVAARIPHANPKLVYVMDDPRLGVYKDDFKNGLYIFEEREPGDVKKTYSTPKVLEELQQDNDNKIDDKEVLQARLLDMFMMDFDRHEDQWRWGRTDNGKGKTYYAIPRDRDQPFFINQGVFPKIISRSWLQPRFQGFRMKAKNINTFNFNGRYFDRLFLNGLTREEWEKATDAFIPLMTDSVIELAVKQQPYSLYNYSGPKIIETLKARRAFLKKDVMDYYKFLAKAVDVYGSDKKEWFDINRNTDGSVSVKVYKVNKEGGKAAKIYDRTFVPSETKEIRLWGMGADDHFEFTGDGSKTILVRVIAGAGNDEVNLLAKNAGGGKTKLYDLTTEDNKITGEGAYRNKMSDDPAVHNIDRRAYKYNVLMPMVNATFNPDDGIFLGLGLKYTGHGFRKEPNKVVHQVKASYAFATGAYNFRYDMNAVDVIGKADVVLHANIKAPNNTSNFFGLGNETIFDKSNGRKIKYYRSRYNLIEGTAMLKFDPSSKISILAGPIVQFFHIDSTENMDRILKAGNVAGIDPKNVFNNRGYVGARVQVDLDARNNKNITTRGFYWHNYFQSAAGTNSLSSDVSQLASDLSVYISFNKAAKFVIAGRVGAGINFGKYEFFQAQYLGNNENLRGFRRFRFGGDKMVYNNIDLRLHLFDFRGYLLPGAVGLLAFNDVGRVWYREEESSVWHDGFGGGIWLSPGKRYIVTFCYAHSKDGGLPFVSLGFQF